MVRSSIPNSKLYLANEIRRFSVLPHSTLGIAPRLYSGLTVNLGSVLFRLFQSSSVGEPFWGRFRTVPKRLWNGSGTLLERTRHGSCTDSEQVLTSTKSTQDRPSWSARGWATRHDSLAPTKVILKKQKESPRWPLGCVPAGAHLPWWAPGSQPSSLPSLGVKWTPPRATW